jgi:hypothetical protein
MRKLLTIVALFALSMACGPVQSTAHIIDARAQMDAAREAGAEKHALYEWTLSELYLRKANEQVGRSQYEIAIDFAQRSMKYAATAKTRAEAARRNESLQQGKSVVPLEEGGPQGKVVVPLDEGAPEPKQGP